MPENLELCSKDSRDQNKLIHQLEQQLSIITRLLYTTSVSGVELDRSVLPYIANDIVFKDPWQEGGNKHLYRVGMKGFHNMFHFTFDTFQLNVKLNDDQKTGRCIVDGIMNVNQFSWIYSYPLRSILVYEFRLLNSQTVDVPQFEIFRHEEMWSLADMIDAIPIVGWLYKNIFRRGLRLANIFIMIPLLRNRCPLFLRSTILRIPSTSVYVNNSQNKNSFSLPRTVFDVIPKPLHPYVRLSRIDKPTGSWVIFLPCAWSIALAGTTLANLYLAGLFGIGTILLRGAGCTINDLWDKEFDRRVERTKSRPIASGELSIKQGILWAGVQLSLGFLVLIQLNFPTIVMGVFSLIPLFIYPVMKRYTNWPQICLGITLNWGVLMGFTAATGFLYPAVIMPLYFASIAWTLHYDTIYAHQDKQDDILVGVKSTALLFGKDSKLWLRAFSIGIISHLITAGLSVDQAWPYYAGLVGVGYHLHRQIETVNLNDKQSCWTTFVSNRYTGFMILACILAGNFFK
ncbi:unnamed protein product [Rotaria socialis]|uniref:4-hydroxybenzoate polyprenyltransferase, mitochondrial n=2 Tax=Rotaria socialis TaxID=392032 RepID=A0A818FE10_9BILA|nr:unnamed protein product [Rotaria socialis]